MRNRIFSCENPKAEKAVHYGYLNAIHYMAPASLSGYNMCAASTPQCRELCLGWEAGQASMVKHRDDLNSVRLSRIAKAKRFSEDREEYMHDFCISIESLEKRARRLDLLLAVRPNGSTDVPFERLPIQFRRRYYPNVMEAFPQVQFIDYTKRHNRFNHELPPNYHLTYSRAEGRSDIALQLVMRGISVAIVSRRHRPKHGSPLTQWCGVPAIDGDAHDLRHLDPKGVFVALSPKGPAAKRMSREDTTGEGFIL